MTTVPTTEVDDRALTAPAVTSAPTTATPATVRTRRPAGDGPRPRNLASAAATTMGTARAA